MLKDGSRLTIRPISAADKAELNAGLGRLSEATVHKRFLSPKTRFSSTELRYLTEVDGRHHAALVAEERDPPHRIVAVARYVELPGEPGTADVAIVVGDALQGQGLGSVLAAHLAEVAVREGVLRFSATMLGDNRAAHRLMAHLTDHLERRSLSEGQSEVIAELQSAA